MIIGNNGDKPYVLNDWQITFYNTTFNPQPGGGVIGVQLPILLTLPRTMMLKTVLVILNSSMMTPMQICSNDELFDLENVEEVAVHFDISEKLEILNERPTE